MRVDHKADMDRFEALLGRLGGSLAHSNFLDWRHSGLHYDDAFKSRVDPLDLLSPGR